MIELLVDDFLTRALHEDLGRTLGVRALEKAAERDGGGRNHRFGLDDAILGIDTDSPERA
jgi:nicotinate-nucleotide pyrophosphorylase